MRKRREKSRKGMKGKKRMESGIGNGLALVTIVLVLYFGRQNRDPVDIWAVKILRLMFILSSVLVVPMMAAYVYGMVDGLEVGDYLWFVGVGLGILVFVAASYEVSGKRIVSKLHLQEPEVREHRDLARKIDELRELMQIKQGVEMRVSPMVSSPVTVNIPRKQPLIVVPADFNGIIDKFVETETRVPGNLASALRDFMLLHELSHIRNGDLRLLTILQIAIRTFPVCAVSILVAANSVALANGVDYRELIGKQALPAVVLLLSWIILRGIRGVLLQVSEYLADIRSAYYMNQDDVDLVVYGKEESLPRISRFLSYVSASGLAQSFDGNNVMRFIARTHPGMTQRTESITRNTYLFSPVSWQIVTASSVFIALGLGLVSRLDSSNYIHGVLVQVYSLMLIFVSAAIFAVPWRHYRTMPVSQNRSRYLSKILPLAVYFIVSFMVAYIGTIAATSGWLAGADLLPHMIQTLGWAITPIALAIFMVEILGLFDRFNCTQHSTQGSNPAYPALGVISVVALTCLLLPETFYGWGLGEVKPAYPMVFFLIMIPLC